MYTSTTYNSGGVESKWNPRAKVSAMLGMTHDSHVCRRLPWKAEGGVGHVRSSLCKDENWKENGTDMDCLQLQKNEKKNEKESC